MFVAWSKLGRYFIVSKSQGGICEETDNFKKALDMKLLIFQSDILQSSTLLCSWEKIMKDFRQAKLMLKVKVAVCLQNLQEQEKMSKKLEEAQ